MKQFPIRTLGAGALVAALAAAGLSDVIVAGDTGPSTQSTPYVKPVAAGVRTVSVITVGDTFNAKLDGVTPYRMIGLPDGMGGFDNGDGTFTLLVNHEAGSTAGVVRAHGSLGATVSAWIIERSTLKVLSGQDLIRTTLTWNATTQAWVQGTTAINRLCSADLAAPSAYFDPASGKGTRARVFLSGEETSNGRAFAHIASGPNAGVSYEIPRFGRDAWENLLACPKAQEKTIVACIDDTTPGQVYFYVGTKTASGLEIERAGFTNGRLYGVIGNSTRTEDRTSGVGINKGQSAPFSLADLGDQSASGAVTQTIAGAANVTEWLRPEDGAWDPRNPADFYFVTTDRFDQTKNGTGAQVGRSRLWRLRFADIANPEGGGQVTLLLDGSEAHQMFDNLCVDRTGRILIQEDPGNVTYTARIWEYEIATGTLTEIAKHDVARFGSETTAATLPFSTDEESSGIFDAADLLGPGWFLFNSQAHGGTSPGAELIENGQILALYNPASVAAPAFGAAAETSSTTPAVGETVALRAEASVPGGGEVTYSWAFGDGTTADGARVSHAWMEPGVYTATVTATHTASGLTATSFVNVTVTRPIAAPAVSVALNFAAAGKDTVSVSGTLPVDAGFSPTGAVVTIDVGGVERTFTLDSKGRGSAEGASIRLTVRKAGGAVARQRAPFTATIRGALAASFTDEGLVNATVVSELVAVPVSITFGEVVSESVAELIYSAKQGKSGSAK